MSHMPSPTHVTVAIASTFYICGSSFEELPISPKTWKNQINVCDQSHGSDVQLENLLKHVHGISKGIG